MKNDRTFIREYKERKLQLSREIFEKRFSDILKKMDDYNNLYRLNPTSFQQTVYNWLYEITEPPRCPVTGEYVLFDRNLFKYKTYRGKGIRTKELQNTISEKRKKTVNLKQLYNNRRSIESKYITFNEFRQLLYDEFMPIDNMGGFVVNLLTVYPEIYNFVNSDAFLNDSLTFAEKIYRVINNITHIPICQFDNTTHCNFLSFTKGYSKYGKTSYRGARKVERGIKLNNITILYEQNDIKNIINDTIDKLKSENKSTQNLYQSFYSKDPKLVKSILEYTKEYPEIKFSNRVHLLLNGPPSVEQNYIKPVFYSLDRGYDMRFEHSRGKSKPEKELLEWLSTYIDDLIPSDRTILDGKEIDILAPSRNIGIEFNGIYWHNYDIVGKDSMVNKTMKAQSKGVKLLHIFETEWINKKDIVKSLILSKFGIYTRKIYARKCVIKEIDSQTSNLFLESNHLQGKDNSKIKLGLFYDGELVSVMTFGQRKITGNNDMELIRFCNVVNTTVIGGASKLFKHFINKYKPTKIKSYANLRISNGELYNALGFTLINRSVPNYWYYKPASPSKIELKHRSGFQKHRLHTILENYDSNKTEWQNMKEHGYHKIYDCGNLVYSYDNSTLLEPMPTSKS